MNKSTFALAVTLLGISAAQAGEFDGVWLGANLGSNYSDLTGLDNQGATAFGLEGGYNWDVDSFLLGVGVFADLNGSATHNPGPVDYGSRVYGLDGKVGWPMGHWMPYAKLGYAHITGNPGAAGIKGSGAHVGMGVEYKFTPALSVSGEYTRSAASTGISKLSNNNLTLGINYYFDAVPFAEPVVVAPKVAAPVQEVKPVVPVTEEEPKTVWKTLLEDKPVTFSGVSFDKGSAKLLDNAKSKLDDVAEFAKLYPDAQLKIAGYADFRVGKSKKDYNLKLSERRAEAFKAALVEKGVAAERIMTEGFGFERPVADNKTEAGRAQNRRVEIRSVIRQEKRVPE